MVLAPASGACRLTCRSAGTIRTSVPHAGATTPLTGRRTLRLLTSGAPGAMRCTGSRTGRWVSSLLRKVIAAGGIQAARGLAATPKPSRLAARGFRSALCAPLHGSHAITPQGGHIMARKQNPEQPVGEIIAESATVKSRSFGTCRFAILGRVAAEPALRYTAGGKAVLDLTLATTAAGVASLPHGRLLGARGRDPGPVRGQGPGALRRRAPRIPRARGGRPPHQAGGPRGRELPTPRSAAHGLGGHGRRARRGGGRVGGSPCGGAGGKTARAFPSLPRLVKKGWFEIGQPAGGGPSPAAPSTRKGSGASRP